MKRLNYQHPQSALRVMADKARPAIRREFLGALKHLGTLLDVKETARLSREGRWREIAGTIPWTHFREVLRKPFDRLGGLREEGAKLGVQKINGAFAQRGRKVRFKKMAGAMASQVEDGEVLKDFTGMFNFDRFSPATQAKIRAYQDAFISGLETDARDVIEAVVLDGLRAGMTPDELADDIRAVIGLTDRQAKAALNYRRMLFNLDPQALQRQLSNLADDAVLQAAIDEGNALEQAAIDAMFTNYIDNSLDYRAATIAQTESVRAASAGLQDAYDQAVDRGALTYESVTQHWALSLDERTCPACISVVDNNPDGVALDEMFDSDDGPIEAPPLHVNCLTGDALIAPGAKVTATSERWYDGDLIVIRTAAGNDLSCTPNHPILTPSGWVPAHLLDEGDDVIRGRLGKQELRRGDVDNQNVPTRIEDIAKAFRRLEKVGTAPVPMTAKDFHGDGVGSKVAIVAAYRLLRDSGNAATEQHPAKAPFSVGDMQLPALIRLRRFLSFFLGVGSPTRGVMGLLRQCAALFRAGSCHPPQHAFAAAGRSNARCSQPGNYGRSAYSEVGGDTVHGVPGRDPLDHCGAINLSAPRRRLLLAAKPLGAKPSPNDLFADIELARQINEGNIVPVERDQVVGIRRVPFSGHVYNLETEHGFYEANGIITHNCRCSLEMVTNLDMLPGYEDQAA